MTAKAVISGVGVLAPTGLGLAAHWAASLAGRTGIAEITEFDAGRYPSRLAGQVTGFDPGRELDGRILPQTDQMTRLALVAADWALADADVDPAALPDFAVGVVTASSAGGFEFGHRQLQNLWDKGPEHVSAYQSFAWFYAVNSGQISIRHGLRGPSGVLVTEQAGGLDAIGEARRLVLDGQPMMVTGGVDGSPCPWGWVAQLAGGRISTGSDPGRAYLPFDAEASGFVPGAGGALFTVESAQSLRDRGGGGGHGVIAGYAATFDPPPGSGRDSTLRRAIELALADAGLEPADIGVVFADAAGLRDQDALEAAALRTVFGPFGVPVTAPKTLTGRLSAGGAALDVATALMTLRHGLIPPTIGPQVDPDYELDLVVRGRTAPIRHALVLARGYRGYNAALVLSVPDDPSPALAPDLQEAFHD